MSRSLGTSNCKVCGNSPYMEELPRLITVEDTGTNYFDEYQGMLVANAACPECGAKYLAWIDDRTRINNPGNHSVHDHSIFDLSYRSTFNDEPGDDDLPTVCQYNLKRLRESIECNSQLDKELIKVDKEITKTMLKSVSACERHMRSKPLKQWTSVDVLEYIELLRTVERYLIDEL